MEGTEDQSTTENLAEEEEKMVGGTEDTVMQTESENDNDEGEGEDGNSSNNDDASTADLEVGDTQETVEEEDNNDNNSEEETEDVVATVVGEEEEIDEETPIEKVDGKSEETKDGSPDDTNDENGKKRNIEETKSSADDDEPMPTLPLKRARTAYFIFADAKRAEVKEKHPGEGVAAQAKAIGALWSALEPSEKEIYETQAATERTRVARDMQRLKDAGLWPEKGVDDGMEGGKLDESAIIFPIGRIRKICKLDPDVKGMSKESALLITKATELFCTKLGKECVTMAQMQNRRKLMPDDVVEVCTMKEAFMFLKADLVDLRRAQQYEATQKEKENGKDKKGGAKIAGDDEAVNTLESYFGKVRN